MKDKSGLLAYMEGVIDERKATLGYLLEFASEYEKDSDFRSLLEHLAMEISQQEHHKGAEK